MQIPTFRSKATFFSNKNWSFDHIFWFTILCLVWMGTLGWRHLIPSDEGRYAEIAREMLVSGDWIVPRYNNYLYFEKPPLQMWATALMFKLFGLGEWQARFWSGLTSILTIAMVWYTGLRIWGLRAGTISALILASCPLWVIGGHFNSLDMGVAFFMSAALCSLLIALSSPKDSSMETNWMLACWAMMGFSVLSKGLIGIVLPGLVLIVYAITCLDFNIWRRLNWVKGLLVFFVITAPWFIVIIQRHPSFFHFFFIHEHFERFATSEHKRTAPWHFFLPLIAVGFLPWLIQLPHAIRNVFLEKKQTSLGFKPLWMCWIWVSTITLFFSLSSSKLPGYIFPVFPAMAILTGVSLFQMFEKKRTLIPEGLKLWKIQLIVIGLIFIAGFFFLPKIQTTGEIYERELFAEYSKIVGIALSIGVMGCTIAWKLRHDMIKSCLVFSSSIIALSLTAGLGHKNIGSLLSGYDMSMRAKPSIRPEDPLYGVKLLEHSIPFYLEHPLIMVNFKDELAFGISQEPNRWIPTEEEWITEWKKFPDKRAFAIMSIPTYESLLGRHVPMEIISQDPIRIIVGKPGLNTP